MGIDHDAPRPKYLQIADLLRARIESGELPPDRPLPSEPQLVAEFGVSPQTARKAHRVLIDEGLAYAIRGKGTYVKERD